MRFLLLLLTFLLIHHSNSQILSSKQEKTVRDLITKYYGKNGQTINLNLGGLNFLILGKDTFYSPNGYNYVFQLKGDTAIRLDSSWFHGGNFERYLFGEEDKIFHLGGYGFYLTNNNLQAFELVHKKWHIQKTWGEKPNYIRGSVVQKDKYVYVFFNNKSGNNTEPDIYDNYIYRLDLDNYQWARFENINFPNHSVQYSSHTRNYVLAFQNNDVIVLNKRNLKYIIVGRDEFYYSHFDLLYKIDGDKIQFGNSRNTILDMNVVWKSHEYAAKDFILEPAWHQLPWVQLVVQISFLLLLGSSVVFAVVKNRNKLFGQGTNNQAVVPLANPLFEKIAASSKNILDIDELDKLLEIDHMEFDSRKLKRHRILNDLEKSHPGFILRQKDETDKRRFIYEIKKR